MTRDTRTTQIDFGVLQKRLRDAPDRSDFLNSDEGGRLLREDLTNAIRRFEIQLVSVDVFDTVLLRRPVSELRRYWLVSEAHSQVLSESNSRRIDGLDVLATRLAANRAAYRTGRRLGQSREGRYVDILRATAAGLGVVANEKVLAHLTEVELRLEIEQFTLLNQTLWDALIELDYSGVKTVLFSDMYLHSENLRRLFELRGLGNGHLEVFTSADVTVNKRTGMAFEWIAERFDVRPNRCLHVGDDQTSDFRMPKAHGWKALLWPASKSDVEARARDHEEARVALRSAGFDPPVGWALPEVLV